MGEVEVVAAHQTRAVVRVGDLFLKIDADAAKSEGEVRAMAAAPVPTPEIAWQQGSVLALRRVRGASLDDDASSTAWAAAGAAARRIHDTPAPEGWPVVFVAHKSLAWLEDDRRWLLERELVEPELFDRHVAIAHRHLDGREVTCTFLHGDLQAAHVFVEGDLVTAVIDWADSCIGDPLFDVAVLTGMHLHRLDDVLAGYGDADRDVVRGWWSLRRLGELRWMVEHGFGIEQKLDALRRA